MTSPAPDLGEPTARRIRQVAAFVVGLCVVWLTVWVLGREPSVDLAIALLVVLAEVLAVATLAGPWLGVLSGLAAVVLVNWYLVPPYRTFEVANPENVAALVVFTLVAGVASWLVELAARARAEAAVNRRQSEALASIVAPEAERAGLDRLREVLSLDHVALIGVGAAGALTLRESGAPPDPREAPVVDVAVADGYRVVGHGAPRLAADPAFVASLADAAVRAYESERMEAERARAEELAAVDRARSALLAGVGHDLRTPLAGLRVAVDGLRAPEAALSEADRAELLETVADASDRLDELITNLLDLSRLEAGSLITRPELSDVGEAVARAVVRCTDPARVRLDVDEGAPEVLVDPVLLERIVANLVSNALRHTPPGSPVEVAVRPRAAGDDDAGAEVVVRDHGPGIAEGDREVVLAAFHQLPGADDAGTGLGLAVVAGFAASMGVGLELTDTAGGGLTVVVTVPRRPPARPRTQGPS